MLKHLRQQKADLTNEANAMFAEAAAEGRNLTDEEARRDDEITAELAALDLNIARAERQADRQRALSTMGGTAPVAGNGQAGSRFASLGEQLMAVMRAERRGVEIDSRLTAGPTGLNESVGADGGFLVQTDFSTELLEHVWENGEIASRIRRIPIGANSNGLTINGVDETSRANGARSGGIQAFWTGEAQLKTPSQPKFRPLKMDLVKLTGLCYATDEVLQDTTALEAWLKGAFEEEFTFKIEDAVVNGTGAGMPLGLLNSGAVITVPKEAGQVNASFVQMNLLNMFTRMPTRSRKNAVWLVNGDIEASLMALALSGQFSLPQMNYQMPGVNGNAFAMLMGRPVIPCEYCAPIGTPGDIIFADLSQYLGIDKGPMQTASSIHVRFIYDESVFRFVLRFNGQPIWNAPVTPYKGSTTVAPFVVLAAR